MAQYRCGNCGRKGHNARTCSRKKKASKKKTPAKRRGRGPMSRGEKVGRWGPIVARYKSQSSDKVYQVRRKGNTYSCNCPGWVYKRPGKARSCRHVKMARAAGKRCKRRVRRRRSKKRVRRQRIRKRGRRHVRKRRRVRRRR